MIEIIEFERDWRFLKGNSYHVIQFKLTFRSCSSLSKSEIRITQRKIQLLGTRTSICQNTHAFKYMLHVNIYIYIYIHIYIYTFIVHLYICIYKFAIYIHIVHLLYVVVIYLMIEKS